MFHCQGESLLRQMSRQQKPITITLWKWPREKTKSRPENQFIFRPQATAGVDTFQLDLPGQQSSSPESSLSSACLLFSLVSFTSALALALSLSSFISLSVCLCSCCCFSDLISLCCATATCQLWQPLVGLIKIDFARNSFQGFFFVVNYAITKSK